MLPLVYMYKRLASLLSHKWDQLYCKTMNGLASWQPDFLTSELFHHVYIYHGDLIFMWSCPTNTPSSGPDDQ